jgi:hypothetical protein
VVSEEVLMGFQKLSLLVVLVSTFAFTAVAFEGEHGSHGKNAAETQQLEKKIGETIGKLSPADQKLAIAQRFCAVMPYSRLGEMGVPIKVSIEGKFVFVCCKMCVQEAKKGAKDTVKIAEDLVKSTGVLAKLSADERIAIERQKFCPILNKNVLGVMGPPAKLVIDNKAVYLCCEGCKNKADADKAGTLKKANELVEAGLDEGHE